MHFALVHGAYHGAWCWDQLRQELERDGHATSAADLPCEDPEAGAERYADEVVHAMPKTADGVVLVGHSLAGLTIPIVAGRVRTAMSVYLCAMLPVPGLSFDAQHADLSTGFELRKARSRIPTVASRGRSPLPLRSSFTTAIRKSPRPRPNDCANSTGARRRR